VEKALVDLEQGRLPTKEQVKDWHRYQMLSFLQGLPKTLSVENCKKLEDILELEKRNDDYFYAYYYAVCIASGYQEIMPRVEKFFEKIGRMLYLMPVGRALMETEWSRGLIRPLFERVRERHHPVTVATMDMLLKKAGL
jgi:hypothetical protein